MTSWEDILSKDVLSLEGGLCSWGLWCHLVHWPICFFNGLCRDLEGDGLWLKTQNWEAIEDLKNMDTLGLYKDLPPEHGKKRMKGAFESGEWGGFWTTHPCQSCQQDGFFWISVSTRWVSNLDYSWCLWKMPHYFKKKSGGERREKKPKTRNLENYLPNPTSGLSRFPWLLNSLLISLSLNLSMLDQGQPNKM